VVPSLFLLARPSKFKTYIWVTPSQKLAPFNLGVGELDKAQSMQPVCHCGLDRAACGACGKGYAQEIAQGRKPKFQVMNLGTPLQDQKPSDGTPSQINEDFIGSCPVSWSFWDSFLIDCWQHDIFH